MIDRAVEKQVVDLWKNQNKNAMSVDFYDDPRTLQGVYSKAIDVMNRATSNTFKLKKDGVGSWISEQSLPIQLLSQDILTVDLSIEELSKQKPFNIPIRSLVKLENMGYIYLNIRDYDSEKNKGFSSLCAGKASENLSKIIENCKNVYIGSALREPIFNACLKWEGLNDTIDKIQLNAFDELSNSFKAFNEEFDNGKLDKTESIFRGEKFNLTGISWNYAFLKSVRSKIDDYIFDDYGDRIGIQSKYEKTVHYGNEWIKTKDASTRLKAGKSFQEFAGEIKTYHQLYTANITASWGTAYNFTDNEYIEATRKAASIKLKNDIRSNANWQKFVSMIYSDQIGIKSEYLISDKNIIYSEGIIDSIIELKIKKYNEINAIYKLISDYEKKYINDENFISADLEKLYTQYNVVKSKFYYGVLEKLFVKGIKTSPLSIIKSIDLGVGDFWDLNVNFNLPEVVKRILIPSKDKRMLFNIYQTIKNEKK
ncbi:MAG: hypothetical protein JXR48_00275 [Candidatus Delongbacteria bacterium]|nr:hypothetical protein [Candidatus Delongbacteria bacterium]